MTANYELRTTWREAVVSYVNVLFKHLPGKTEENHKISSVRTAGLQVENQSQEC